MGAELLELEESLRSSQNKMTPEEARILATCKANAFRAFTITAGLSTGALWAALWKFGYGFGSTVGIAGGTGVFVGMRRFNRSLNMSVDKILSMEGSRLQRDLANLILSKRQHDPSRMQLMKKHFYMEKVFDDSNQDRPMARWRLRNYFVESQRSHDTDSNDNSTDSEPKKLTESKQLNMRPSPAVEVFADPFDCVFGYSGAREEIHRPDNKTSEASRQRRSRDRKKSHRRQRAHQAEA